MATRSTVQAVYKDWAFIKALVDAGLMLQYTEDPKKYVVWVENNATRFKTELMKAGVSVGGDQWNQTQNDADRADFLNNYAADANGLASPFLPNQAIEVTVQSQSLSNKLRYAPMTANQSLTKDAYTTVYEYTGSGQFFGLFFVIGDSTSEVQITVDGEKIIQDFPAEDISIGGPGNSGAGAFGSIFLQRSESDEIALQLPIGMKFESSIKLELKAHSNSGSQRKMVSGYAVLTKET
jgi:hypothetical protein